MTHELDSTTVLDLSKELCLKVSTMAQLRFNIKMRSIVLTALSLFLGLFFILMAVVKLTPAINHELHREIRQNFVQFSKFFPVASELGYRVSAKWYRVGWGTMELVAGTVLALIPSRLAKIVANSVLLVLTIGAGHNHYRAGHKFDRKSVHQSSNNCIP